MDLTMEAGCEERDRLGREYLPGDILWQNNTRVVRSTTSPESDSPLVMLISNDIIVDRKPVHDSGRLINAATCGIFALLEARGIPTAFKVNGLTNWFIGQQCKEPQGKAATIARHLGAKADHFLAEVRRQTGRPFADFYFEIGVNPAGKVVVADVHRFVQTYRSPEEALDIWGPTAETVRSLIPQTT